MGDLYQILKLWQPRTVWLGAAIKQDQLFAE